MKILHFIYDHTGNPWVGGGGAVRAYEIYRRLANKHEVTIISGRYPGVEDYAEGKLKFRFVGTRTNNYVASTFSYAFKAALFLTKHRENADIVVEDFAPYNPMLSKFLTSGAVAIQVHHKEGANLLKRYLILGLPFLLIESLYPKCFGNAITVSETSKEKFGLRGAAVIPNGIDSALLETTPTSGNNITFLGRLQTHNKGLDTLMKAMTRSEGRVAIAGRGRDEERLKALAEEMGVGQKIAFKGHLTEEAKGAFLSGALFLVLPSRYEGQGIVLLEAAACGKPVVVSDIPELRFAVEAGFGLSFRTGDAEDLAEKMNILARDETLREEMGKKGRVYARECTWDRIAERYEEYLVEVRRRQGA